MPSASSQDPVAPRRYDGSRRTEQAAATRRAVVSAARTEFANNGYARTTFAAIARTAGVSVETVYKTFRSKAGLALAVHDAALIGDETDPTWVRADRVSTTDPDPVVRLRAFGSFSAEVAPRVAPFRLLLRAAADDP